MFDRFFLVWLCVMCLILGSLLFAGRTAFSWESPTANDPCHNPFYVIPGVERRGTFDPMYSVVQMELCLETDLSYDERIYFEVLLKDFKAIVKRWR